MNEYIIIGILLAVIALTVGWMFVTSKAHYLIKCAAAAVVLSLSLYSWTLFTSIMGFAVNDLPPDKSFVISQIPRKEKGIIYVWILNPPEINKGPQSFVLPYTEKRTSKLEKALQKAKQTGSHVIYHRPAKGKEGAGDDDDDSDNGQNGAKGKHGGKGKLKHNDGNDRTEFDDDSEGGDVTVESPLPPKGGENGE